MATVIDYILIAALVAVVFIVGTHVLPTYNVAGTITVHKFQDRALP